MNQKMWALMVKIHLNSDKTYVWWGFSNGDATNGSKDHDKLDARNIHYIDNKMGLSNEARMAFNDHKYKYPRQSNSTTYTNNTYAH